MELAGCKLVDGFWVPADERDRAIERRFRADPQIDRVVARCKQRRAVVQAGGNWGYWPRRLAGMFAAVYTFEPNPVAFSALAANTAGLSSVIRVQAALGDGPGLVGLEIWEGRSGAAHVRGSGIIPTFRIDALALDACDMIYLDIEGMELPALMGGAETIAKCRPVVAFEDKGHASRYGHGSCKDYLAGLGYRAVDKVGHDTVMMC